jgi:peptide/nickel transport system substrate-binding protein
MIGHPFFKQTMKIPSKSFKFAPFLLSAIVLAFACCKGGSGGPANGLSTENKVVWHVLSDIDRMNPYLSSDNSATYVQGLIWEALSNQNPRTLAFIPSLAELPVESPDHLTWTFKMDRGAKWSDGQPVTPADVIFSYKTVMNPLIINASAIRGYFNPDLDSAYYPNGDQGSVALHFRKFRYDMLSIINYVKILPKHIFDPKGLTDKMSWADLHDPETKNPAVAEFSTWFQDEKIGRDSSYLIGSGPYKFMEWIANDRITLKRDTNYWGRNLPWGEAYPDKIIFKTIKDQNAALTALKAKDIDVNEAITPSQYLNSFDTATLKGLKKDSVYGNVYTFIAWNNERPMFKSKKTRQALTMLINREEIQKDILHNLAKLENGPIPPTQPNFDPTAKEVDYNPDAGKKMLADDGWAPGPDGILQKTIDGKVTPFKFTFQVNAGNDTRKQILLVVSEELKKVGIVADVQAIEWSVYLENTKSHHYDACYSGWVGNAGIEDDIYQLWHSSQMKNKGSNYYCFSDPEADKLLTDIQTEPDKAKRFDMSHRFQHIVVDDQPVTFMFSQPFFIGWVDRFDNFEFITGRPPYMPWEWIVRGSGVKRAPGAAVMSLNPAERTEPTR